MAETIRFKKYSNRRLYDTSRSRYVTLEDLAAVVRSGTPVAVTDAGTGEDVTAFVLTQIVLEEARKKNILLPVPVLHMIIQYGDNALGEFFEKYLQQTIRNYLHFKKAFDDQFSQWLDVGRDMARTVPGMGAASPMEGFMQMFSFPDRSANRGKPDGDPENTDKKAETDK